MPTTHQGSLPAVSRHELETLRDLVREDQPRMVQYKYYERLYRYSLEVLHAAESHGLLLHGGVLAVLQEEARRAELSWARLGFRVEIDDTLARIRELTRSVEFH